jgi:hypothetical protein
MPKVKTKIKKIYNKAIILLATCAFVVSTNPIANAASSFDTHTITFDLKGGIEIDVVQPTYGFGSVDPWGSPYYSAENAITVNVKSNTNWTLYVKGDQYFTSGTNQIPISRLSWSQDNTNWNTMSSIDSQVTTGGPTGSSGTNVGMEYRLVIQYDDPVADGYQATITYTGVTP